MKTVDYINTLIDHCTTLDETEIKQYINKHLTEEQLLNYNCPIQILSHGHIPHTVLEHHD